MSLSELKACWEANQAEVARLYREYEAFLFCGDVDSAYRVLDKIADLKEASNLLVREIGRIERG